METLTLEEFSSYCSSIYSTTLTDLSNCSSISYHSDNITFCVIEEDFEDFENEMDHTMDHRMDQNLKNFIDDPNNEKVNNEIYEDMTKSIPEKIEIRYAHILCSLLEEDDGKSDVE